jgi:F-type H+-transporting ATPase subunit epsilon
MAERSFRIDVVTPDRVLLSDEAVSLVAPGVEGYLGILPNHAPLVTELATGELRYKNGEGDEVRLAVSGGFLQVADNRVTVLADAAERAEEISVERARAALDRALALRQTAEPPLDRSRTLELEATVQRARNRLKIAGAA